MMTKNSRFKEFSDHFLVPPGKQVDLQVEFDPADTGGFEKPENAAELLREEVEFLASYQEKLYAENSRALLIILQALDAAGKDSTIEHVMSGLNPQACQVYNFKTPSVDELDHDYLWRAAKVLPARGNIAIFNRSYYEEVLVVRVHPKFLDGQRLPEKTLGKGLWQQRFREINNFEKYLVNNGFEILKIYLNLSKEEQCRRQLARIDTPEKNWKFNPADIQERKLWAEYISAYEQVFAHTSTKDAPWYVVPADAKWFARLAVAGIIANKLVEMDPQFPVVSDSGRQDMMACRDLLADECGKETVESIRSGNQTKEKKKKNKKKKSKTK